jgi:hypothetical protein
VKLEQASKGKSWMSTRLANGEDRADRKETPGAGKALLPTDKHLIRSTGVVTTACREGDPGNGSSGLAEDAPLTPSERMAASLGVGEGHRTDEAG